MWDALNPKPGARASSTGLPTILSLATPSTSFSFLWALFPRSLPSHSHLILLPFPLVLLYVTRQDGLDLVMGNYTVDPSKPSPFVKKGLEAYTVRESYTTPTSVARPLLLSWSHGLVPSCQIHRDGAVSPTWHFPSAQSGLYSSATAASVFASFLACSVQHFSAALFLLLGALVVTFDSILEGQS